MHFFAHNHIYFFIRPEIRILFQIKVETSSYYHKLVYATIFTISIYWTIEYIFITWQDPGD